MLKRIHAVSDRLSFVQRARPATANHRLAIKTPEGIPRVKYCDAAQSSAATVTSAAAIGKLRDLII
jgi:hypothetical protein